MKLNELLCKLLILSSIYMILPTANITFLWVKIHKFVTNLASSKPICIPSSQPRQDPFQDHVALLLGGEEGGGEEGGGEEAGGPPPPHHAGRPPFPMLAFPPCGCLTLPPPSFSLLLCVLFSLSLVPPLPPTAIRAAKRRQRSEPPSSPPPSSSIAYRLRGRRASTFWRCVTFATSKVLTLARRETDRKLHSSLFGGE